VKLHEAMAQVLADQEGLSTSEIARQINRLGLYTRRDGQPVPATQIGARANNYQKLFVRAGGMIFLVGQCQTQPRKKTNHNFVSDDSPAEELAQKRKMKKGAIAVGLVTILSFLTYVGINLKRHAK
jgi:hypothetical protein